MPFLMACLKVGREFYFIVWGSFHGFRIWMDWFSEAPRLRMAGRENGELVAIGSNVSYAGHLLTNSPV